MANQHHFHSHPFVSELVKEMWEPRTYLKIEIGVELS